ncbi:hypothetical protein GG344DRAFT_64301 [Lentinula edodes]|nr:hypothetical protein GG344DRAFT_64301 [Lentinula edodes]
MYHDIDDHSVTGPLDNAPHKHKWGEAGNKPKQEKTEGQNRQRAWAEKSSASQADVLYLTDFHTLFYRAEYDYMAEDASVLSFVTGDIIEWGQSHTYTQSTSSVVHMGQALMEGTSSSSTDEWWVQVQQEEEEEQKVTFGYLKLQVTVKYSTSTLKEGEQFRDLPQEAEDDIDLSMTDDAPLALVRPSSSSRTGPGILGYADLGSSSAPYASEPGQWEGSMDETRVLDLRRFRLTGDAELYLPPPEDLLDMVVHRAKERYRAYPSDFSKFSEREGEGSEVSEFSEVDLGVDIEFGDWSNSDASSVVVRCSRPRRVLRGGKGKKRKQSCGHGSGVG